MRINVSRLRKTFINRIHEILDGDLVATSAAAGNSPKVTALHYLRPSEKSKENWRFMGQALVEELLTNSIGSTEKTPTGRCTDTKTGQFAPKKDGQICMSFVDCLRCRNYVVTGDDLYRLFSFYWRILRERSRMDKTRWQRQLAHIIRLIDRDVIEQGLAKGIFKKTQVAQVKDHARRNPHPYWRSDVTLETLGILT